MKRVCAWCGTALTFIEEDDDGQITHTICDSCAEMIREEMKTLATTVNGQNRDTLN